MFALTTNGSTEQLPDSQKESAMQRYWRAKQAGDTTAHLLYRPGEPAPQPPSDNGNGSGNGHALAESPTNGGVPGGTVSLLAQERIHLHEKWLADAGFSLPPPLYAPGTRVLAVGDQNFRTERKRVEDLPLFPIAAERIREAIAQEERADLSVQLGDVAMDDSGLLDAGAFRLGLELDAFRQLATLAGFGAGVRYLAELCDAQLRGENVSWQLRNRARVDKTVVLRTRAIQHPGNGTASPPENIPAGRRAAYAVVTPTYAAVDSDQVLDLVATELADAHTEMLYDGAGIRATALFMPDEVVDLAAGDVFKVGVRIQTDDSGRGRIRIGGVVFRNLCLNLLIIGEGEVETVNQVHRGDTTHIRETVREGVVLARQSVGKFLEAWGHARTVKVQDPGQLFEDWLHSGKVAVPGERDQKKTMDEFLAAFRKEPGDSLADCVNAVSRAAHEVPRWGQAVREDLERQAARLVLMPA